MTLRDELPTQTLSSFSVKHDEIARLQAEIDAYLAAGGRIDVVPVCRVVPDISPAKREKMLESSIRGNQASANTRAYGKTPEKKKYDPLEGGVHCSKKGAAKILGLTQHWFYEAYRTGLIVIPVVKTYKSSEYFLTSDVYKLKKERENVL